MNTVKELLAGYRRFRAGTYRDQVELYRALGEGQDPNIMMIACADSRADPTDIFDAFPGQLFVIRNVANLVPPYDDGGALFEVSAGLEFAVTALKVRHIVVMGHGSCGGISASLSAANDKPVGRFVAPWVSLLDATRDKVLEEDPADVHQALEFAAIGTSLDNLMSFPCIRTAVEAGSLQLHGAWFAIAHGELSWRDPKTGKFETVSPSLQDEAPA